MANRYCEQELKEFEGIIVEKLEKAKNELSFIKEALSAGGQDSGGKAMVKVFEDNADAVEKENLSRLASRQHKFISQLEASLFRIKNGTYGVCASTGNLIDKERLRAVPHTTHSIQAKLERKW